MRPSLSGSSQGVTNWLRRGEKAKPEPCSWWGDMFEENHSSVTFLVVNVG